MTPICPTVNFELVSELIPINKDTARGELQVLGGSFSALLVNSDLASVTLGISKNGPLKSSPQKTSQIPAMLLFKTRVRSATYHKMRQLGGSQVAGYSGNLRHDLRRTGGPLWKSDAEGSTELEWCWYS